MTIPVWQMLSALKHFAHHLTMPCSHMAPCIEMQIWNADVKIAAILRAARLSQHYSTLTPLHKAGMGHSACRQEWTDICQAQCFP